MKFHQNLWLIMQFHISLITYGLMCYLYQIKPLVLDLLTLDFSPLNSGFGKFVAQCDFVSVNVDSFLLK